LQALDFKLLSAGAVTSHLGVKVLRSAFIQRAPAYARFKR
jgi:hypothetical protein